MSTAERRRSESLSARPTARDDLSPRAERRAFRGELQSAALGVRARVLISFLILLLLSTGASLFALRSVLLSRIGTEVQSSLTSQVDRLRQIADSGKAPDSGKPLTGLKQTFDEFLGSVSPVDHGALATFINGRPYKTSTADPGTNAPSGVADFASITKPQSGELATRDGPARYVAVPISSGANSGTVVAIKDLSTDRSQVESAIRIAVGVSVVVMLLASLFIWLAASRAMAPLHALAGTTRKITETDLSDRVAVRGSDELAELGKTFNGMLDRLETAFADQKEFLADVGHELRTPITVIRGHLETAGDDPAEREEANTVIEGELARMSRLVDDLLMLARSGRPDFLRPEPIDLDLLTHDLFIRAQALGDRRWVLEQIGLGIVQADSHRIASAVMNLAQNAVKHTTPGEEIAIGSSLDEDEARIWVRDAGPGINPTEQERIFERFAHAEEAPGGGAGLGLAIVRAIAESHGGRIELESRPGWGATFTVVLPTRREEKDPWPGS